MSAHLAKENLIYHLILNAFWEPLQFELPARPWRRWVDTALDPPHDIVPFQAAPPVPCCTYTAEPRSIVALYAEASE